MKIRISKKASKDIDDIWEYTFKNWSFDQANKYFNLIMDEIEYLSNNFNSGKSINHIKLGYKVSKVKSHYIFYKSSRNNELEIIRVLHQKMDIDNRIGE